MTLEMTIVDRHTSNGTLAPDQNMVNLHLTPISELIEKLENEKPLRKNGC